MLKPASDLVPAYHRYEESRLVPFSGDMQEDTPGDWDKHARQQIELKDREQLRQLSCAGIFAEPSVGYDFIIFTGNIEYDFTVTPPGTCGHENWQIAN